MKLLHLNVFKGRFLKDVIEFSKKENFDILQFQEVSGGDQSYFSGDNFEQIKSDLHLQGEIVKTSNPMDINNSFFGNATFIKKQFQILDKKIIWTKQFNPNVISVDYTNAKEAARAALILLVEISGKKFYLVNCHLAWGPQPDDKPYKINQAKILLKHLKTLKLPIIMTGDFNVLSSTQTASMFESIATNLTKKFNIPYTINPRIHFLKQQAVDEKLAVDMVFASKEIHVIDLQLVKKDLSDHLGIVLEFKL